MGHDHGCNLGVVVDHLALAEARLGVKHLVEIREFKLTPIDFD
jgi:hypothetical protein